MKIGVIGAGNMGSSIIKGLANKINPQDIYVQGHHVNENLLNFQKQIGFNIIKDDNFSNLDVFFVTTPAQSTLNILNNVKVGKNTIVISCASGVKATDIKMIYPNNSIITIIPNIPVSVNSGILATAITDTYSDNDLTEAIEIMNNLGKVIMLPQDKLSIASAVGGCGPAFVDIFMSALSDAGVENGLSRDVSYKIAENMVYGAAKLALDTGKNPAELKDEVTAPGGETIKGVVALDDNGFRKATIAAVNKAYGK